MEAWGLGVFMVSACVFGVILFHPDSYFAEYDASLRNIPMGIAMGLTALAIFKSPWGMRSGAYINPAVTLAFFRLGKIGKYDAFFYVLAQFVGATVGVALSRVVFGDGLAAPGVNYVATLPGSGGLWVAFGAEFAISFLMMAAVLYAGNHSRFIKFTPFAASALVAVYIAAEAPISGMSMNPARTFGSAVIGNMWTGWWIYFTAPPMAMLAAAEVFARTRGLKRVFRAKLDHSGLAGCVFDSSMGELIAEQGVPAEQENIGLQPDLEKFYG